MSGSQLINAVTDNNEGFVKKWLNAKGNDINAVSDPRTGNTPLHVAVSNNNTVLVKMLLKKGANINAQDLKGWTPLHCAAHDALIKMCDLLISSGADVTITNSDDTTPLHYIARASLKTCDIGGQHHIMNMMIERGADVNAINNVGVSALEATCRRGVFETVEYLLLHNANIEHRNSLGETCLHDAVQSHREEMVDLLLRFNANVTAKNSAGKTPIDIARETEQESILKKLLEKEKTQQPKKRRSRRASKTDKEISDVVQEPSPSAGPASADISISFNAPSAIFDVEAISSLSSPPAPPADHLPPSPRLKYVSPSRIDELERLKNLRSSPAPNIPLGIPSRNSGSLGSPRGTSSPRGSASPRTQSASPSPRSNSPRPNSPRPLSPREEPDPITPRDENIPEPENAAASSSSSSGAGPISSVPPIQLDDGPILRVSKSPRPNNAWQQIATSRRVVPQGRIGHTTVAIDSMLILIGGSKLGLQYLDEIFSIDLSDHGNEKLTNSKRLRASLEWVLALPKGVKLPQIGGHTTTLIGNILYIFGGRNALQTYNDIWAFNTRTAQLSEVDFDKGKIPSRCNHTTVAVSSATTPGKVDRLLVFGGSTNRGRDTVGFIHSYYIEKNTWVRQKNTEAKLEALDPELALGRQQHTATMIKGRIFFFGGSRDEKFLSDLLVLNTVSWEWEIPQTTGDRPTARAGHCAVASLNDQYLIIFGGHDQEKKPLDGLYFLDLSTMKWKRHDLSQLVGKSGHSMTILAPHGSLMGDLAIVSGSNELALEVVSIDKLLGWVGPPSPIQHSHSMVLSNADAAELKNRLSKQTSKHRSTALTTQDAIPSTPLSPLHGHPTALVMVNAPGSPTTSHHSPSSSSSSSASSSASSSLQGSGSSVVFLEPTVSGPSSSMGGSNKESSKSSRRAMLEHITALEDFSTKLSDNVVKVFQQLQAEIASPTPFANEAARQKLIEQMTDIQAFCFTQRPPKKAFAPISGESKAALKTSDKRLSRFVAPEPIVKEKLVVPKQHYDAMILPPKRKQPEPRSVPSDETDAERELRHRDGVANEIVTTETDYIRDLGVLIGLYLMPLRVEFSQLLTEYDMQLLFKNIEVIFEVSKALLEKLEVEIVKPPREQMLGALFLSMVDEFTKYKTYCTNRTISEELVQQLLKDNLRFVEFVEEVHKLPESHSLPFGSFVMAPFQRIFRYPLLLKELLRSTPSDWPDHPNIVKALDELNFIVKGANDTIRTADTMAKVLELQNSLSGISDSPQLRHLHKQVLIKDQKIRIDAIKSYSAHLYLFKEVILITKPKGSKQQKRFAVPVDRCYVFEKNPVKFTFDIIRSDKQDRISIVMPTKELMVEWMQLLNDTISDAIQASLGIKKN